MVAFNETPSYERGCTHVAMYDSNYFAVQLCKTIYDDEQCNSNVFCKFNFERISVVAEDHDAAANDSKVIGDGPKSFVEAEE